MQHKKMHISIYWMTQLITATINILAQSNGHINTNLFIDFDKENNKEDPKFKVGDHVRRSKHKNVFLKGCFFQCRVNKFLLLKRLKTLSRRDI